MCMRRRSMNAQRAASIERARWAARKSQLGKVVIGVAIVAALAGTAYGLSLIPDPPENVHWHPTWEAYVNDQNVRWEGRQFDMSMMGGGIHFHQPNDDVVHAESRSDRLTLGDLLVRLRGAISDESLTIPSQATPSGEFRANGTARLQVFVQPEGEGWREIVDDFQNVALEDRARVLVTFNASGEQAIIEQQNRVAEPKSARPAPDTDA